ncbi:MAG: orotate phosphoribosyltransferase [Defluviitaleaceae bacterium]|nr:orotate phosphoribosyltransferase [Defluviitaleaceae bacterium]
MDYKSEFITFMARAGALTFGDFVTKSGRRTPYFVNTGKYSDGGQISRLGNFYADCIMENVNITENTVLFGPAYKGVALAVSAAVALSGRGVNVGYCFNRKEVKDHGEGGALVGHKLTGGDRVLIIEDVITAGTAVREVLPILQEAGAVVDGLIISVDRMERGAGERTAIQEIWEEYNIPTFPIVNVRDILKCLHNNPVDGKVLIDDGTAARIEAYMEEYCV